MWVYFSYINVLKSWNTFIPVVIIEIVIFLRFYASQRYTTFYNEVILVLVLLHIVILLGKACLEFNIKQMSVGLFKTKTWVLATREISTFLQ